MSGQATGWVLRHGPRDRALRLVLIAIADAANRDGEHSHAGHEAIADGALYSAGHIRRAIARLIDEGWLVQTGQSAPGRAAEYFIPGVREAPEGYEDGLPNGAHGARRADADGAQTARIHDADGAQTARIHAPNGAHPDARPTVLRDDNGLRDGSSSPTAPTSRGSRLPDQFLVTDEMRAWASEHVPDVDWRDQTSRFCDYWRAQPGQRGVKLDWTATWRNWLRTANERRPARRGTGGSAQEAIASYAATRGVQ